MSQDIFETIENIMSNKNELHWYNYLVYLPDNEVYEVAAKTASEAMYEAIEDTEYHELDIVNIERVDYTVTKEVKSIML